MTDRLFGLETEYAMVPACPSPTAQERDRLVTRMAERAQREMVSLPDGTGRGVFLANGARFYFDCGHHPEMTTPEVASPWDAVRYVLAGERTLQHLADGHAPGSPAPPSMLFFKHNVDYDTHATWGCHESIMHRADPAILPAELIPHLVSRVIFTGAGGFDPTSPGLDFLLSPRAVFLERESSHESTSSRGIFHTKNETLSGPGYQRLHILCGESLCSELAMWLRTATTVLVVAMIEGEVHPGAAVRLSAPVGALRTVAGDPTCRARVNLADGSTATPLDIQRHYLRAAEASVGAPFMPPWAGEACIQWRTMLDRLEHAPDSVATSLDWAIKRALVAQFAASRGFSWGEIAAWTEVLRAICAQLADTGVRGASSMLDPLIHPTDAVRHLMRQRRGQLREHGLSWDELPEFARLRQQLFEADVRFSQLGASGVFARLDRDQVLTHHVPGVDRIEDAVENPPAIGRARLRSVLIRRLAPDREAFFCNWAFIVNLRESTALDLSNPFETAERWTVVQKSALPSNPFLVEPARTPPRRSPAAMRIEAYHCFLNRAYERAEQLLQTLAREGFELPDILSHLARVLIITDRVPEARHVVEAAWEARGGAPVDVVARLLWFQVFFGLLEGSDVRVPLGRLKSLLLNTERFSVWTLTPMLRHIRPSLSPEAYDLLRLVFDAWSDRGRLHELDRIAAWRECEPLADE